MFSTKSSAGARLAWRKLTMQNSTQSPFLQSCTFSPPSSSFSSSSSLLSKYNYETLKVTSPSPNVLRVDLNRPEKLNAMNKTFWLEISRCFDEITDDENCRAVVVAGEGRVFTAGLDLGDVTLVQSLSGGAAMGEDDDFDDDDNNNSPDVSRKAFNILKLVASFQDSFTSIERCPKPVIAAIHGACVGGGVDLVCACDVRYATNDAFFQIKEVDIGLAADVGTLQRLPRIVGGDSLVRELCYTARKMPAEEALGCGLVSRLLADKDAAVAAALKTAELIAEKSPVAVQGTKHNLIYARDHSVPESLRYMAAWNSAMLQSEDVMKAAVAAMSKEKPKFKNL